MSESMTLDHARLDPSRVAVDKPKPKPRPSVARLVFVACFLAAAGGLGWLYFAQAGKGHAKGEGGAAAHESDKPADVALSVNVVKPVRGGMAKITDQPGTIRAFEFAPLYAKISGYLKVLKVDRGDRVKKGDLLAEIFDPELNVAVTLAEASLDHSNAEVVQAEARLKTAEVGVQAALAKRNQAKSLHEEAVAQRTYRAKALERIRELARNNAVEEKLADEEEDKYMGAVAGEHSAQAGIETAEAMVAESKAAVEQARADLVTAKAQVKVAKANLEKAKVMVDYTQILSPYDGVVISRGDGVHPGAFIRSASDGNSQPLLIVARNDLMRTIVQVPDRDVPFCDRGDPVTIKIDALGGRDFEGTVSRMGESEDLKDRTMRVEIDLSNPDGILRDGMFGRAVIRLEPPSKNLTIPASSLIEKNSKGEGAVYTVKDGKVKRVNIRVGKDSGLLVEVLGGLSPEDEVIPNPSSSIADGINVRVESPTRLAGASSDGHGH